MLQKKEIIGPYTIAFPIKEGAYAETYRVKDEVGKNYFLKLIDVTKLHHTQFDDEGNILELEIAKQLKHPNITSYHDSGKININNKHYVYIVFDFISGETLLQQAERNQRGSVYEAKTIAKGVLNGLSYMHNLEKPVIHNEITAQNIMIDMSTSSSTPKIIDLGYARYQSQGVSSFMKNGLNPFYLAPEALSGIYSVQSDLYSVGVMMYYLLFGMYPYYTEISQYKDDKNAMIAALMEARLQPLLIPNSNVIEYDESIMDIIAKATAMDPNDRFRSADEFIKAINGEIQIDRVNRTQRTINSDKFQARTSPKEKEKTVKSNKKTGNGFKDVAGMTELKEQLQSDVIDVLRDPERAKELGISIPNGLLFYGPPGCGKTFFAEKFAEELGCNYMYVLCSDVASPYIHGGQEKIASIFEEAKKNAPTILVLDEVEAMITDRRRHNNVSEQGEVNEFLGQLNNCGEDGVLVIAATNEPEIIDPAALRAGRLELKYYIPQPNTEMRKEIFQIGLKERNTDVNIDYDKLAELTENRVSADIKLIIDTAARYVFRQKLNKITQEILEKAIEDVPPTVSIEKIREAEKIRDNFIGKKTNRSKIGFN